MTVVRNVDHGVEDVMLPLENDTTQHVENLDSKPFFSSEYVDTFRNDFPGHHPNDFFHGVPVSFYGGDIANPPYSPLKEHKPLIWISMVAIVALLSTILALSKTINPKFRAEQIIHEREREFKSLWEYSPISCWYEDFSAVKNYLDSIKKLGVSDLERYFNEQPEAVFKCSRILNIIDVNQATLTLYKADSKDELLQGLHRIFDHKSFVAFQNQLIDIWNGKTGASYVGIVKTLDNEVRDVTMSYKILPGSEESLQNILVTVVDITNLKMAEAERAKSRAHCHALMQAIPDLIWLKDKNGAYLSCNAMFENFFGIKEQDILGKTDCDLIDKKLADFSREHDKKTVITQNTSSIEGRIDFTIDGLTTVLETSKIPIFDNSGIFVGILGIGRNITDHKLAEDALGDSKREYRSTIEGLLTGVVVFTTDIKIKYCNQEASTILDLTAGQILSKEPIDPPWKFVYENLTPIKDEDNPLHKVISSKSSLVNFIVGIVRPDKSDIIWILANATPLFSSQGILEKIFVNFINISDQKKRDEEKEKLTAQLQHAQKMEAIGTLAGGIAHDFNNILSAILGYSELAKHESPQNSKASQYQEKVLIAGHRAKRLVNQILSYSHRTHTDSDSAPLNIKNLVEEAIKMLRPTLPSTIEIVNNIEAEINPIFADPTKINQILMNLSTNAFHAMEDRGGTLEITAKETRLRDEDLAQELNVSAGIFLQLSVSDSGTGIPPEIRNNIFEPYFTTKETGKGTGLGLYLVHGVVRGYGGFMSVHSKENVGTTIDVYIPSTNDSTPLLIETLYQNPTGTERILLIDDEEMITDMGQKSLEMLGYHVTVSNRSIEALELFQKRFDQFDVVVTDQTMPGMTGYDLAREMLQIRADIPIILCTGNSTTISKEKTKLLGIKEFALKPLSAKEIAALIRKAVDNERA